MAAKQKVEVQSSETIATVAVAQVVADLKSGKDVNAHYWQSAMEKAVNAGRADVIAAAYDALVAHKEFSAQQKLFIKDTFTKLKLQF
jgi:hypothetical protein